MAKDANGREDDWQAVGLAIRDLVATRGMPLAQLARKTGLSENTIRYMGKDGGGTESPLVAIAAVFDLPLDFLRNILHGEPEKNVQEPEENRGANESPVEAYFEKVLHAELGPVKKDVATLRGMVDRIDQKIDRIIEDRNSGVS